MASSTNADALCGTMTMAAPRHIFSFSFFLRVALLAFSFCAPRVDAFGEASKYLIVSSPLTSKVAYMPLPSSGRPLAAAGSNFTELIGTGLTYPQGVAVDQYRKMLYVADPQLGKLVRYPLRHHGNRLGVGPMQDVAANVETRAVAVDGLGNVWFTDEPSQRLLRITARQLETPGLNVTPEVMYNGSSKISAPGGIALDNFFVYWMNKASGATVGSLIRALQEPPSNTTTPVVMADNANKCYGVCLAQNNIFYTNEVNHLYGINRASTATHKVATISSSLAEPRGCAFDGDNTVYVADKGGNALYQFASNMNPLMDDRPLTKAADLEGPFGVAVYVRVMS